MKDIYAKRKTRGYTLGELLATVAILVILMAIAVPAIFTIRRNLRQKALDNKAEIIYTAVQNNLTKLHSNGNSVSYAESKATELGITPMDSDDDETLYYVVSTDKEDSKNAASVLATADTLDADLYSHYWVVEYDPSSASVYSVFYSESREDYTPASYDSLRYKKNRLKDGARVGYYGGDSIESDDTTALVPKITVNNEEKLQVVISSKRPDDNPLSFDVELSDTQGHTITLKYGTDSTGKNIVHKTDDLHQADSGKLDDNESGQIRGNKYTLTLTLDAMDTDDETGCRFSELYGSATSNTLLKSSNSSKQLIAGTALSIKVTVHSKSSLVDGLDASAKTNSLFGDDSTDSEAEIKYGRHLQNLDENSKVTDKITSAVQKSDIHFEEDEDKESGTTEDISSWYSCYKNLSFHPITNKNIISYKNDAKDDKESDSAISIISHLTTEAGKEAGLFAETFDDMTISGIALTGASINGKTDTDDSYAGAFVAYAKGTLTIDNCRVYLETSDIKGKTDENLWIQNAGIQGGLVGCAEGKVVIKNSFAATVMGGDSSKVSGGLIGEAKGGVTISSSYADSYISGNTVGGLIGKTDSTTSITGSYSVGYLKANEKAGGLAAEADDSAKISLKDSYTAVTWVSSDDEDSTDISRYSTIPADNKGDVTNTYFLHGGTDYSADEELGAVGEKTAYSGLSNVSKMCNKLNSSETYFASASSTNAYNLKDQGLTGYSYPEISGLPHYGDWQASFEAGSLVYYEVYNDGTVGFYGGNITPSLRSDLTVVGDGYGVVYASDDAPTETFSVLYQTADENGNAGTESRSIDPNSSKSYSVSVESVNYVIYPLPSDIVNAAPVSSDYYHKIIISGGDAVGGTDDSDIENGNIFYYNPYFAKTVTNAVADGQTMETPKTIYVRTARQLYALSKYYNTYAQTTEKSTFTQELDINYGNYEWTTYTNESASVSVQNPIGGSDTFKARYDGGCHVIDGISFAGSTTSIGLFGDNEGTIQNVFLASDYSADGDNPYLSYNGQIRNNKKIYMGALAGINRGQITNCAVSGFYTAGSSHTLYVRQNGTLYFGGLVGSNRGTIRNSEVDTPLVNANILYGKAYIGGFAGENTSAGRITNCYSVGKLKVEYSKGETSIMGGFTAQNTGLLSGDYCAVTMTSAGSTETYAFAKKGGNINSCTYLGGGTFRYLGKMEAYDNTSGSGSMKTYADMKSDSSASRCCSATSGDGYPFKTVVKDSSGQGVHFGNWQIASSLGSFGILYWEKEESGSNNGYHFSYIGYEQDVEQGLVKTSGDTLCEEHDDGGIITEYGYAYYYDSDVAEGMEPTLSAEGFQVGEENLDVSQALSDRLDGFTVVAYTTAPSIQTSAGETASYMKMTSGDENGVWTLTDNSTDEKNTYTFTINPFFGNAMQYGTEDDESDLAMPGENGNKYEIRSAQQLQYMNWNNNTGDAVTTLDSSNYTKYVNNYTYLGQEAGADSSTTSATAVSYIWTGSDAPAQQQYVLNSDETCSHWSWNGKKISYYVDVTVNTEYWEFVEDSSSSTSYSIKTWSVTSIDDGDWRNYNYRNHYTFTTSTKTGYWKWVGSGKPSDGSTSWKKTGGSNGVTDGKLSWIQSHDVDADMTPNGSTLFTQIGSLYDTKGASHVATTDVYVAYFVGSYDGNTYSIKNIEINSSNAVVGLFGAIVGGKVKNITLYSERENYIQRTGATKDTKTWYAIGGLCGLAGTGTGSAADDSTITNCTVSGYIIRDNSQYSAWGDGNVGGMLGISTMDISQCTAVNTIELNSVFTSANGKSDGVSVRTGGLVGSMRGTLTNSYTGGEITATSECYNTAMTGGTENGYGAKLFLGGLTGGVYLKDDGNLGKMLGNHIQGFSSYSSDVSNGKCSTATQTIQECYTYIKMPSTESELNKIYSISPIGSNGETQNENATNRHVRVEIKNCYYYKDNIPQIKTFAYYSSGNTNIDTTPVGLTWEQMQNELFTYLHGFSAVTSSENGQSVDGKYTFPGNNTSLDGENYPFPSILTQSTSSGGTVYVHYGEWPNSYIYWEESRADMDIFESMTLEDGSDKGKALKTFVLKDDNGKLGTNLSTKDFEFTYNEEDDDLHDGESSDDLSGDVMDGSSTSESTDDLVAEVTDVKYDSAQGGYVATVWAHKTGTETITVTAGDYSASFTLTVTANLTAYASQSSITVNKDDKTNLQLYALSGDTDLDVDGTDDGETVVIPDESKNLAPYMTWQMEMDNDGEDFLEISDVRKNTDGNSEFTISCKADLEETDITLTITGTYTYEGIDYTTTTWVEISSAETEAQLSTDEDVNATVDIEESDDVDVSDDMTDNGEESEIDVPLDEDDTDSSDDDISDDSEEEYEITDEDAGLESQEDWNIE